jgi:diguanylate cyclase (GGDEF)-like protein/PAS domain S-box-containing protein
MRSAHHTGIGGTPGSVPAHGEPSPIASLVESWPGPAAFVARDGTVRCANAPASSLLATLIAAAGTVRSVASGRVLEPLTIAGARGTETYELTAIPLADGVLVTGRDISLTANMRVALADSRRRYKDLVEISSDFAWETDRSGAFVFVSPRGALGFSAEQLVGRDASFILIDDEPGGAGAASPFAARRRTELQQVWVRGADGTSHCVAISALPLFDADGAYCGARGLCRDVTEAMERDTALAEARNRERLAAYLTRTIRDEVQPEAMLGAAAAAIARALGASGSAIWRFDGADGAVCAAEFGAAAPAGIDPRDLVRQLRATARTRGEAPLESGQAIAVAGSYRQQMNGAAVLWRSTGGAGWSESDRAVVADFAGQLGIALAQLEQHESLARLARNDAMTGLLNRRTFSEMLDLRLAQASRSGRPGALLFVDLDNFKLVNDRFGHQRGDEALKCVADRLRQGSRVGDLVARLGGDEFALWLEDVDEAGAVVKARALLAFNAELAAFSGDAARPLGLSVGVAVHQPAVPETGEELVLRADAAMYLVKHGTKNGFGVAAPAGGKR